MLIDKNRLPLVAMDFMNRVHLEDADIINHLYGFICACVENNNLQAQDLVSLWYKKWLQHTEEHFAGEEKEMFEKQFQPYSIHRNEHQNCLAQMRAVLQTWEQARDPDNMKLYLESYVRDWLLNHIETLDAVTAVFLKTAFQPMSWN